MKTFIKFLTICFCALIAQTSKAQEKFSTYDNTYSDKTYEIKVFSKEKDKFSIYIDALSLDATYEKGGIYMDEKQHEIFLNAITEAKTKYAEWVKTAKENNVKELHKLIAVKSKVSGYFMYGSKWNFQFTVNLKFEFKILESVGETKYLLIIRTGELQSSSNQFIKVDGFVLVFGSVAEIEEFTTIILKEKVLDFVNAPKKEELFKD